MIRDTVRAFVALGPLPSEFDESVTEEQLVRHQEALGRITRPVSDDEAQLLLAAFGPDGSFGAGWSLLHLIETAPHCPLDAPPAEGANEWLHRLWRRVQNARALRVRPNNGW
jgi:hypothetical protein